MKLYRWIKKPQTGSHTFHFEGKRTRLTPNDTITCAKSILGNHLGEYNCLGEFDENGKLVDVVEEVKKDKNIPFNLVVVKREKSNWYDVINPENPDKPINTKTLKKAEAEALASGNPIEKKRRARKK